MLFRSRHEPALLIGNWFSQPENAQRIGQHLLQIMSGFLELTDDSRIQRLIKRAVHKAIDKVDLSGTSALMLESMTKNNRHQVLLDTLIAQLIALLQRDSSRAFIARQIVHWLETEHPLKAKILPTEWLDERDKSGTPTINKMVNAVERFRVGMAEHIYSVNNSPYGYPLEYEGHSRQAPAGMVRISCIQFEEAFAAATAEAQKL